jgi:hypothetical protein
MDALSILFLICLLGGCGCCCCGRRSNPGPMTPNDWETLKLIGLMLASVLSLFLLFAFFFVLSVFNDGR